MVISFKSEKVIFLRHALKRIRAETQAFKKR